MAHLEATLLNSFVGVWFETPMHFFDATHIFIILLQLAAARNSLKWFYVFITFELAGAQFIARDLPLKKWTVFY